MILEPPNQVISSWIFDALIYMIHTYVWYTLHIMDFKCKNFRANLVIKFIPRLWNVILVFSCLQALLKLISDCSHIALNPSKKDSMSESPLQIALFSLGKMCAHPPCRQFLRSSPLFPVVGRLKQCPESLIAKYASVIVSKVTEVWAQNMPVWASVSWRYFFLYEKKMDGLHSTWNGLYNSCSWCI